MHTKVRKHLQRYPYSGHDFQMVAHCRFSRPGFYMRQSQLDALANGRMYQNVKTHIREDNKVSCK